MRRAKWGLIGCGRRATIDVLPQVVNARGFLEFAGVCDIVGEKARMVGEKYQVPYYTSAESMLQKEKDMDFVYISSRDYQHHVLGKLAAEYGKHVLVEKPMAVTLPCCDILVRACEKAGVYYEVGEQYFRCPTDRAVMKIIQGGLIGDVFRAHVKDPEPAHTSDSGVCMDMGVHCMSEIRTYIGSEPARVIGSTKKLLPRNQASGTLQEDWGFALVEFEKGQVGTCECSTSVWDYSNKDCYREVDGTNGVIHVDARTSVIEGTISLSKKENGTLVNVPIKKNYSRLHVNEDPLRFLIGYKILKSIVVKTEPEIIWENPYANCYLTESRIGVMDEFVSIANAALHDKPPEYGIQGRRDVEMCVAWYESSLKEEPVKLPITSMTTYEKMVHEDYRRIFGHVPTDI